MRVQPPSTSRWGAPMTNSHWQSVPDEGILTWNGSVLQLVQAQPPLRPLPPHAKTAEDSLPPNPPALNLCPGCCHTGVIVASGGEGGSPAATHPITHPPTHPPTQQKSNTLGAVWYPLPAPSVWVCCRRHPRRPRTFLARFELSHGGSRLLLSMIMLIALVRRARKGREGPGR